MTHALLNQVANFNGGGLSVAVTGKYTSVRHERAKIDGKLTAGEAAKFISKELKQKISAKELVAAYKLLNGCEPEWHHAGFYKLPGKKSTMGRTFFFNDDNIQDMIDRWSELDFKTAAIKAEEKLKSEIMIWGFYYNWDYDYSGAYGKKRNHKVLHTFFGSELNKPKNFVALSEEQFNVAVSKEGKKYYGWDEPTIFEFI